MVYLKAWNWIKDNVLGLVSGLAAILGVMFAYKYHKDKVGSLKDAVAVEKAKKDIARHEAKLEERLLQADAKEEEIVSLDDKVKASKRRVVEIEAGVKGLNDDEVADEFQRLGY